MKPLQIAEFTGHARSSIEKVIEKWKNKGTVEDLPRPGRPVTYASEEKNKIINKQLENRFKTTQAIYEENKVEGSDLSYGITRRIINYNFITKNAPSCNFKGK